MHACLGHLTCLLSPTNACVVAPGMSLAFSMTCGTWHISNWWLTEHAFGATAAVYECWKHNDYEHSPPILHSIHTVRIETGVKQV
jgi:hypothetical protein